MKVNPQPGTRKVVGPVENDASSQMHSSHHYIDVLLSGVEEKWELTHCVGGPTAEGGSLPPSSIAEPAGVHLSHVTHSNDANHEILHHGGCCAIASAVAVYGCKLGLAVEGNVGTQWRLLMFCIMVKRGKD